MEDWERDIVRGVSDEAWIGIQARMRNIEQRQLSDGAEIKRHADELRTLNDWMTQMGLGSLAERERRGFPSLMQWWIARQTGIHVSRARLLLWGGVIVALFSVLTFGLGVAALLVTHHG